MTSRLAGLSIAALASYRITRLVTTDTLVEATRAKVLVALANAENNPEFTWGRTVGAKGQELLTCHYCVGFWVSALTYWAWRRGGLPAVLMEVMAVAGAQSLLSDWEGADK